MELVKLDNNPQSKYIRYFFDNISNATYTIKDEQIELYIFDQIDDQNNIICGIKYFDEFTIFRTGEENVRRARGVLEGL